MKNRSSRRPHLRIATLLAAVVQIALPAPAARLGAAPAMTAWTSRWTFAGREFTSIVSPPDHPCALVCTMLDNGGIYESTDCGLQWASLLQANIYSATAKDTNVGYAAAGTSGVLKTVDGGAYWFQVLNGLPPLCDARSIAIHLSNPDTIYCGFYGAGVYVGGPGDGNGVAWQPMNAGLGDLSVRNLARVRGGTYFLAATDGGIWRWEGGTWSPTAPGLVAYRLLIDAADSSRVYAAGPTGVWKSGDQGRSFFASAAGLPAGIVVNDIVRRTDDPRVLYVGLRGAGVYESVDFGASWHPFGPAVPGENDVRAVLAVAESASDTASVFAGTRVDGLFEAEYSTPTPPTTWGRVKAGFR